MRQIHGLVAPRLRLGPEIAWQEIGAVRFEEQPICRNVAHERQQMASAPLVTDPAGDADGEAHVEIRLQLQPIRSEAMSDTPHEVRQMFTQDGDEVVVRIPLMQEHRLAKPGRKLQMPMKGGALRLVRRKVAEVIEAAFAHRDDFGLRREVTELREQLIRQVCGMMGMQAGCREQPPGMRACKLHGRGRAFSAGARDDHLDDAGRNRSRNHAVTVVIEAVVVEVDADVDEVRCVDHRISCAIFCHARTHSTKRASIRMHLAIKTLLCLCFVGLPLVAGAVNAADASWAELERRIQHIYYIEDLHTLANLDGVLEDRSNSGDDSAPEKYYAALASYRLTLLSLPLEPKRAEDASQRCVDNLKELLATESNSAEALALQSACLSTLAELKSWRAPFANARSYTLLEKAMELAPDNPRVLLLDAINEYERPILLGGDKERAFGKLRVTVAAFEAERRAGKHSPGWGAAEAYTFLARSYLDRGDAPAARDALERALLIAPEFITARRLMSHIISS